MTEYVNTGSKSLRVPALDGLRGLAIALVLMMHFGRALDGSSEGVLARLAGLGWVGVDLFFVLSGFLITDILLASKGQRGYYRSFYARRVLRIFPLYYGFLAFVLLLPRTSDLAAWLGAPYLAAHQAWFWGHGASWLLMNDGMDGPAVRNGFGALWSLSIEEQFYLIWPLVVARASPQALLRWSIGLIIAGLVVRVGLALGGAPLAVLYHATFSRLDPILFGAILAILARDGALPTHGVAWSWAVCAIAFGAVVLVALARLSPHPEEVTFAVQVPAVGAAWGTVLLLTLCGEHRWHQAMSAPPLRTLGRYSYAMYLFQAPVSQVLTRGGFGRTVIGPVAYGVVGVGTTFCLAVASWHLLEKHFLSLKRWVPRPGDVIESEQLAPETVRQSVAAAS
jgi:peptidoglycan/LPS O-acetylase OafA/YrhL